MTRRRVAVVGQGVIGLTAAWELLERGYGVDVFFRDGLEGTASMAAGAYWWPNAVKPVDRVRGWARESLGVYRGLAGDAATGVRFAPHVRLGVERDEHAAVRELVGGWDAVDPRRYGVPCREGIRATVPVIDVAVFLPWLRGEVARRGGQFVEREVETLVALIPSHPLVVNATGLGARALAGDPGVVPIRGQSVRVRRPEALPDEVVRVVGEGDRFTLVLPRSGEVFLGGTAQAGDWDLTPREAETREILARATALVPALAGCEVLGVEVGLRPGRREVRLELETIAPGRAVIHDYGHGGAGYTVAWGCAREVAELAVRYFAA